MSKFGVAAAVAATGLLLVSCGKQEPLPTINASMQQVMNPSARTIWDLLTQTYNDNGDALVASKFSDADWAKLADATQKMKERAQLMADNAGKLVVAAENEPIMGSQAVGIKGKIGPEWDAASAEQIHAKIQANPALFTQKALAVVASAEAMNRAAKTRDPALFYQHASTLDETCDGCHEPFWGTDEPPPAQK